MAHSTSEIHHGVSKGVFSFGVSAVCEAAKWYMTVCQTAQKSGDFVGCKNEGSITNAVAIIPRTVVCIFSNTINTRYHKIIVDRHCRCICTVDFVRFCTAFVSILYHDIVPLLMSQRGKSQRGGD